MNLFYANGTPVINSLKIQSEVPLDPRLNPETIEERDSLVTKHIAYDRMKVYVKETDSEYVYHKDKNEWVILSKFEKEEKDKLENIKNYLVDTEIIYDKDNNLLYREHSYDPNTNITSLRDYSIPEATVLGDGTLYNGLLSKFYVNRLNNVTGYQTDAKITSDTETESLFLTVTKYNPDTDESVTTNLNIPLVTDDNNGLVSPEKKHWMDNADGLSNTGTTSQTWQLQKSDIDTRLDPNGGVIIKNSGGKLEVRDNQDNSYAPVTLGDIIIEGNVTQKGESFITQAETVEVRDNTILLNRGETAAGVSKGFAGIEIDRGTLPKFQILFDESDRRFKAGEEGDLWCLALRDDDADMLNGMFTSWDSSTKRLKTTNIIPSDRKLAFTDNNSYLQLTSHSFSGDALNQTLRYSNSLGGIFISAGNTNLNLDTDKTGFYFHKNILLPSTISSVSDFLFKRSDVTKLSLKDTVAQFTVPVTAITFNRASDGSEVLYHADLENTEFKNYITIAGPNDIKLYLKSTDEDNYNLISSVDQDGNKLSNMGYYGSYWAIENNRIVVYKYDANGYPEIINQDGTSPGYLRACTSGFLPNVSSNLASGGNGYLGTSSWAFANAYVANNHSNKYYFGTNDVFLDASTTRISARTSGAAIGMNIGSLLVSNDYSDETKVPNNGIYSKGAIKSYTGFTSDFRISNLTITKTGSDVLHISSFASSPENMPGTDPISSQVINDGVALTYFWQGDYAFQLVGDIDGTGMAYRMYHPSTGTSTSWKFLADTNWVSNKITSVAGNYLPLAGGTMTGNIIMSNNITIRSKDSSGNLKRLIGKGSDNVTYIGDSDGHTFLYSDAADVSHIRNGTSYRIWDASNLTSPLLYASGTAATPTTVYNRNLGVNGSQWTFLSTINAPTTSIFAPTSVGTSGQILQSSGSGAPTWVSGYATQSWVTSQAYHKNDVANARFTQDLFLHATSTTGGWAGSLIICQDYSNGATGVVFGGYGTATTPNYAYVGVGSNRGYNAVNNLKVYTDKVTFGNKTLATVDQIPTIPSISITTSGSGNVVTGISASGHTLTVTKGSASVSVSWDDITGKPSSFTPSAHTHTYLSVLDNRSTTMLPNNNGSSTFQTFFNMTGMPSSGWHSGIWVNGWTSTYSSWQLCGYSGDATPPSNSLYFRSGINSTWNSWKRVAFADEIPTRTSDLTNNSGFLTSSSLSGYATQSWVTNQNYAVQASGNNLIVNSNEFNFANTNTTSVYINYRSGVSGNTTNPITDYRFCNGQGSNSGVKITAETFVGALSGNATTATTASKLGSSTVGGTAKPIYLSAGTATACSATVGSSAVPVYMNAGTITQCSTTLGVSITGNAATATTSTKWNGYDIWVGTESQLPSSRSSTTIYIVTDALQALINPINTKLSYLECIIPPRPVPAYIAPQTGCGCAAASTTVTPA